MTNRGLITQSGAKRLTASAIAEAKKRRGWSNGDAGDALGCSGGTIRNRLADEDDGNPMTVFELLRSVVSDGTHIANAIFDAVGHRLAPVDCSSALDAMAIAEEQTRCAAELIRAAPGGYDRDEARSLLPLIVAQNARGAQLEAALRAILADPP